MKKALLFALLLTLTACANVDPSLTDQTVVYSDVPVRKSALQVSVHPKGKQHAPLTAYFHPFLIQQSTVDHHDLSHAFAQIFFNVWAEKQLFSTMEMGKSDRYHGKDSAMRTARMRGADLLVIGKVPYFYDGTTLDDTAITIQVDIYSTASGQLLWTMMQSGRIEQKNPDDYFYFRHEFRMPQGALNMTIRAIAEDMAIPLLGWLPSPDSRYRKASTKEEMHSGLTGRVMPDGTPAPQQMGVASQQDRMNGPKGADLPAEAVIRPNISNGIILDIHFDFDKATIRPESYSLLDSLAEVLKAPELKGKEVVIGGHTDSKGSAQYNLDLSRRRAQSVRTYLVEKHNVTPKILHTIGYGQSRPLNNGLTEAEQQQNRRVEIRLAE